MTHIVVAGRVDRTTFDITEKVVESLDGTTTSVHALNVSHGSTVGIADGAIAGIVSVGTGGAIASTVCTCANGRLIRRIGTEIVVSASIVAYTVMLESQHHVNYMSQCENVPLVPLAPKLLRPAELW